MFPQNFEPFHFPTSKKCQLATFSNSAPLASGSDLMLPVVMELAPGLLDKDGHYDGDLGGALWWDTCISIPAGQ